MIDWEKYGFKKMEEVSKFEVYHRQDFPFVVAVENDHLTLLYLNNFSSMHSIISEGKIPATNQSVVLLLKAFNCPKLP